MELWGRRVGAVAEAAGSGAVVFEYDPDFRTAALEISPLRLPVARRGPQIFPELARSALFQGLPGVLADALPDAFGNAIIRRWFEAKGRPDAALSPVQRLLYIGRRAMGALEFLPPADGRGSATTEEALEVAALVEQARRVIEGDLDVAVPEMMQVGGSAGGARAKALVLWNGERRRIRSGFATPDAGDEPWLLKFDGVSAGEGGHELARAFRPADFGRIEYVYSVLARRAGIDVPETRLLRERDFAHFMVRRFDRVGPVRLHMHTLGGLHHADYDVPRLLSYEDWFRTIRTLGMGQPAVEQAFRRMVFNLAARNQDDHVKNTAFLMGRDGLWRLAPAYDLTWAVGSRWTATHQMTVAGKDDGFTRADLLRVGDAFDLAAGGAAILAEVDEALAGWDADAREAEVGQAMREGVGRSFRRFD